MKKGFIIATLAALVLGLAPSASALTISPPLMEFDARPGDALVDVVKLYNETNEPLTLTASVQNFKALGETGTPEFLPVEEKVGLASWIKLDETEVTLAPQERKSVLFTINVPGDAEPGGHFAGILWSAGTPTAAAPGEAAVGIVAKTGTLILVRVAGEVNEAGRIVEFSTDKTSYNYLPVNFTVRFENTGNVHLKPTGTIEIRNMWGTKVAQMAVNENLANVLPKSIRRFEATWQKEALPLGASEWQKERQNGAWGKYTAVVTLSYGIDGSVVQAKTSFWVFPWRVALFYLVLLVIIVLLLVQGVKKYNKWLLKKYGGKVA
ncbi:MAG: hypothetical protein QXN96_02360 [Candidatus Bathyarchaeia archaeon]